MAPVRARLEWMPLLASCAWIDDEAFRARLDVDGDGVAVWSDCDDEDPGVRQLDATEPLTCGDVVDAVMSDRSAFGVTSCEHPLAPGSLVISHASEDLWLLTADRPAQATITVADGDGPGPSLGAAAGNDELGGVVLFAWPGPACEGDACQLGSPLALGVADPNFSSAITVDVGAESAWTVVVSADPGTPYRLSVGCR